MTPEPVTLVGQHVRLEPLTRAHAPGLFAVAGEAEIWRYLPVPEPRSLAAMEAIIEAALAEAARGMRLPFAILARADGRVCGSTSYLDIAPIHRRIEIGWTWLGAAARRTAVNTECKLLLLQHAFEALGCGRVQLKTDARNLRSQAAIGRLGAQREGVLRQHMLMPDGFMRDTVMYSLIAGEWPETKRRLQQWLGRPTEGECT